MTSHYDRDDHAFTTALIRRAARSAPPELSERLEEEWLADLASRRSRPARLRLVLGCLWASRVIAHDFLAAGVAASQTTVHRNVVALGATGFAPFSRRSTIFILIVGLHGVLFYAFATGLAGDVIQKINGPTTATVYPDDRAKPPPVPMPQHPSDLTHQGPIVPKVPWTEQDFGPVITQPPVSDNAGVGQGPVAPPATPLKRTQGGPGVGFPNTDDYYPAAAIRQHEEGGVALRVCVNERGQLSGEPTVVQSSGFELLDGGALKLAKAGSGHYRSTTEDGHSVSDCYAFRIRFQLKGR